MPVGQDNEEVNWATKTQVGQQRLGRRLGPGSEQAKSGRAIEGTAGTLIDLGWMFCVVKKYRLEVGP
jgi:hypothetical protein